MSSPGGIRGLWSLIAGGAHRVAVSGILQGIVGRSLGLFIGRFIPQATREQLSGLVQFASQLIRAGQIQSALSPAARIRLADIPVNITLVPPPGVSGRYRYRLLTQFDNPNTGATEVRSMVVWSSRLLANRELVATAHAEGRRRRDWADSLPSALKSDDIQFTSVSVQTIERTR